jgi:hypothetical protein
LTLTTADAPPSPRGWPAQNEKCVHDTNRRYLSRKGNFGSKKKIWARIRIANLPLALNRNKRRENRLRLQFDLRTSAIFAPPKRLPSPFPSRMELHCWIVLCFCRIDLYLRSERRVSTPNLSQTVTQSDVISGMQTQKVCGRLCTFAPRRTD